MLMYSPLSAYFDDVIPQQPALSNDGKQRQPRLGDFTSPILQKLLHKNVVCLSFHFWPSADSKGLDNIFSLCSEKTGFRRDF
jgi:hypothetical protein